MLEWMTSLPPCWYWFLAAAVLAPFVGPGWRAVLLTASPVIGLISVWFAPFGAGASMDMFGLPITPYRVDELSWPFLLIFNVAALIGGLYTWKKGNRMHDTAALIYAAGTMAVVSAGDLISLFIAWEIMGVSSAVLLCSDPRSRIVAIGWRYLGWQLLSGLALLIGALWLIQDSGLHQFGYIGLESGWAAWLLFAAFGIKCVFPLAHVWLSEAYPAASATAVVFLSAFTTKAAIYACARAFPGAEPLIYIGATMACLPILHALMEKDPRRVLAYSMISQIGFILCGIGTATAIGVNGAVAHSINEILFKGLLFMAVGTALGTAVQGSKGRYMPITAVLCVIGSAALCAVPPLSGFISKSLIMSALQAKEYTGPWLALLFAAAAAPLYVGIKIPYLMFYSDRWNGTQAEPPWHQLMAMILAASACVLIGILPDWFYRLLPYQMEYTPYDAGHVLAQYQLLIFAGAAFYWLHRRTPMYRRLSTTWDMERLYSRAWALIKSELDALIAMVARGTTRTVQLIKEKRPPLPPIRLTTRIGVGHILLTLTGLLGYYLLSN